MTHYGLNPSFAGPTSVLPLFADALRRGLPMPDGRLRVFDGVPVPQVADKTIGLVTGGGGVTATERAPRVEDFVDLRGKTGQWHGPSLKALAALQPKVLRTLDWQMTNHRPDWTQPRVHRHDRLQATKRGMAVELQAEAANALGCHLWWPAPARFELPVAEYETRLSQLLHAIRDTVTRPPILEYGNELWNAGFPVHGWLRDGAGAGFTPQGFTWHTAAAQEIATLKRVADRVFGPPGPLGSRPYYLFVGGQLTVPSHLNRILSALADLGVTPDLAGPAFYVTPLKAHKEEWEASGAVPSQDELRASCMARLEEIAKPGTINEDGDFVGLGPLAQHYSVCLQHSVPYFACYEAGQSLIAGAHPWRAAALAAQSTEWMGELYRGIRRAAEAAGVDLLNWYSAASDQSPSDPRVDVFGLLESTDLTKMLPKAKAARGD